MPFLGLGKKAPFRLPFGVFLTGWPAGGITDQLMEGYTVLPERDSPYRYEVRVNASSERLFDVFQSLASLVTGDFTSAIEVQGRNDVVSMYTSSSAPPERVMDMFRKYAFQLTNDGFTGFGIAGPEVEVFVEHHKGVRVCCVSTSGPERALRSVGVPRRRNLRTLAVLPHTHAELPIYFLNELGQIRGTLPFAVARLPPGELEKFREDKVSYEDFRRETISGLEMTVRHQAAGTPFGSRPAGGRARPA